MELQHIFNRLKWTKKYIRWTKQWENIIFSYEKKFNLNAPDGFGYYWHTIITIIEFFQNFKWGKGLIVWLGFSSNETLEFVFLKPRANHQDCIVLIPVHLSPHSQQIKGLNWMFKKRV